MLDCHALKSLSFPHVLSGNLKSYGYPIKTFGYDINVG